MKIASYMPILKTSDSELRALRHLSSDVRQAIRPVFELTRSRISKKFPNGSLGRKIDQLRELYGDSLNCIDLTTQEELLNDEIDALFHEVDGYARWCEFLEQFDKNVSIPCLQYEEGGNDTNFKQQAMRLCDQYEIVVLRTSLDEGESRMLYSWLLDAVEPERVVVIANVQFIEPGLLAAHEELCARYIQNVFGNIFPQAVGFAASSFPRYVGFAPFGSDEEGEFEAQEIALFDRLSQRFPGIPLIYTDYASVHPLRYATGGGNWVPRVDLRVGSNLVYRRRRRDDGGYSVAAAEIVKNFAKQIPDCWGGEQIHKAAAGETTGGSPSFWISVRINMWITERARQLA